jgi:hypothetical protein
MSNLLAATPRGSLRRPSEPGDSIPEPRQAAQTIGPDPGAPQNPQCALIHRQLGPVREPPIIGAHRDSFDGFTLARMGGRDSIPLNHDLAEWAPSSAKTREASRNFVRLAIGV